MTSFRSDEGQRFRPQQPGQRPGGRRSEHESGSTPKSTVDLWPEYLKKGYFDSNGNPWPDLIDEEAKRVAQALGCKQGRVELKPTQLRRFYGKAKNIERKLDAGQSFEALRAEIIDLKPKAAVAVARETATEVFKRFVDLNVDLARKDEKHFRDGFLKHFQSVVAYFTYFKRR